MLYRSINGITTMLGRQPDLVFSFSLKNETYNVRSSRDLRRRSHTLDYNPRKLTHHTHNTEHSWPWQRWLNADWGPSIINRTEHRGGIGGGHLRTNMQHTQTCIHSHCRWHGQPTAQTFTHTCVHTLAEGKCTGSSHRLHVAHPKQRKPQQRSTASIRTWV